LSVARKLVFLDAQRAQLLRNTYKFQAPTKYQLLEPGDLILVSDPDNGLVGVPVVPTSIEEDENFILTIEADPFIYGANVPNAVISMNPVGSGGGRNGDPGSVNAPIIFQPVQRLLQNQNQPQLALIVSGANPNYGGCVVTMSTDGTSYAPVGIIQGNAVTGYTVGDWPAASDPDTTNDLSVDLTESLGAMPEVSVSDEDNFVFPCYVAGGVTLVPYELMAYAVANLTAAYKYTLKATGGGTNHLRRAVLGAPQSGGLGVDHPNNSRFAMFNRLSTVGQLLFNIDPSWIGQTLYFKLLAFNQFGNNLQDPGSVTVYTYTVLSFTLSPTYVQAPPFALSQPTASTLAMVQVSEQFANNAANYNARASIAIPGGAPSVPTWLYVTITDPAELGDTGTQTNLTVNVQTAAQEGTTPKAGVAGFTYIGAILALPAGGGSEFGPGGWPPPQGGQIVP
jgi:hypothetical protein